MPDNIATINGQSAMAYQGETPWHQLGARVEGFASVADALRVAHLDWNVELRNMFIGNTNECDLLDAGPADIHKVPNRRAVVRLTGEPEPVILGTVGDSYQPIQNADAFGVLQAAMAEHGLQIETCGALGKGERVWMLVRTPESYQIVDGDSLNGYFLICSGHDGATPHTGRPTYVRVVCQNTLEMALGDKTNIIKLRHTKDQTKALEEMSDVIRSLYQRLRKTADDLQVLASKKLNALEVGLYVDTVLGIKDLTLAKPVMLRRRAAIMDLVYKGKGAELAPETAWTAYNAFTEYFDHVRPAEATSAKRIRSANESALFGANAVIKARALDLAFKLI